MICHNCKADNLIDGVKFCPNCGAPVSSPPEKEIPDDRELQKSDDNLEFVITETPDSGAPDLFGTGKSSGKTSIRDEGIDISSPSNILEGRAAAEKPKNQADDFDFSGVNPYEQDQPYGPSADDKAKPVSSFREDDDELVTQDSYIPVQSSSSEEPAGIENRESGSDIVESHELEKEPEISAAGNAADDSDSAGWVKAQASGEANPAEGEKPSSFTAQQFGAPRENLHKSEDSETKSNGSLRAFPGDKPGPVSDEKTEEPQNANQITPIADPSQFHSEVKKANRIRGLAYFRGNYIKLVGNAYLHDSDELAVGGKEYLLKTYQLGKKLKLYGAAAGFVLVLLIAASFFISPTVGSDGEIVGMVLNNYGQPYVGGARVTITELGKSTTTTTQGFFKFEMIPTGTYEFIFESNGQRVGQGNATIIAGQTTLMTFGDLGHKYADEISYTPPREEKSALETPKQKSNTTKESTSSNKSSGYGKIKLAANVDDAKFTVDGKILGAGNNTYTKISPGQHKVQVSKDGYTTYSGIIEVSSGKTATVKANLAPKANAQKTMTADDYADAGNSAFSKGDYKSAVESFTKALEIDPSLLSAYDNRAKSFAQMSKYDKAAADYIRCGEIYRFKGRPDDAIKYFTKANEMNSKDKLALVGRAGARLDKSEYRAAKIDYDAALEIDDKFYPALLGAGICEYKLGKNKNAEKYFRKAKDVNGSDPYVYHYLMLNYAAKDDANKVRKTYSEYKQIADPQELAQFKSSGQYDSIIKLIKPEDL